MGRDRRALLFDIVEACRDISRFAGGMDSSEYESNSLVRYAVERRFIVIGEALNRLKQSDPELFGKIPNAGQIIGFRNILVHGYEVVSDLLVWQIIGKNVPELEVICSGLLNESNDD